MARKQRLDVAGGVYHVMVRGADRALLFRDDDERLLFLERVGEALAWGSATCLGWALMPNHAHFVLVRGAKTLGGVMQRIGSWWAGYLNRKDGQRSARLDGRYKAVLVDADEYLTELVRYVHLNPVKAGLTTLGELASYPWSGYAALMGERRAGFLAVDEVLQLFGARRGPARQALATWVAEGLARGCRAELVARLERRVGGPRLEGEVDSRVLGDAAFVETALKAAEEEQQRHLAALVAGWTGERLRDRACWHVGVEPRDLGAGRGSAAVSDARALVAWFGREALGLGAGQVARLTGVSSAHNAYVRGPEVARRLRVLSLDDLSAAPPPGSAGARA
jgi:putative transposase